MLGVRRAGKTTYVHQLRRERLAPLTPLSGSEVAASAHVAGQCVRGSGVDMRGKLESAVFAAAALMAIVTGWVVGTVAAAAVLRMMADDATVERAFPYANAHLLEEAHEGSYSPLTEPGWYLGITFSIAMPIGVVSLACSRSSRFPGKPALGTVVALALLSLALGPRSSAFSVAAPSPIRTAAIVELVVGVLSGLAGFASARRLGRRRQTIS